MVRKNFWQRIYHAFQHVTLRQGCLTVQEPSFGDMPLCFLTRCNVEKFNPTSLPCNAAINACEKGCQWQQAFSVFEEMPYADVPYDLISYNTLISASEKGCQWKQALGCFERMPNTRLQPDVITYSAAISACEKGSEWKQALELFGLMTEIHDSS